MANFFTSRENIHNARARLCGDEAAHIIRVLRMKKGDALTVCDGEGFFYDGIISQIDKQEVLVAVGEGYAAQSEPKVRLTLYQALSKGAKMDLVVQKATEIGAVRIVPVLTHRSVPKGDNDNKTERLRRVAFEACKQSHRARVPIVEAPISFDEAICDMQKSALALLPYEDERTVSINEALSATLQSVAVLIGPEGGFEKEEIEKAKDSGICIVSMGKRILRTETAAIVACPLVMYSSGEMNA